MDFMDEFDALYISCHESLFRTALFYCSKYDVAEDLLQQTVLDAILHFPQLKETAYFKTWITRILINNCKKYYRKTRSIEMVSLDSDISTVDDIDGILDSLFIQTLLKKLSEKYRKVVILRYINDMAIAEISQTLMIPQSTVKSRLYRALEKLKNDIDQDEVNACERSYFGS